MSAWNEQIDRVLIRCREEGISAATTAAILNRKFGAAFTRNAVISRANRMGYRTSAAPAIQTSAKRITRRTKPTLALPGRPSKLKTEPLPESDPSDIPLRTLDELEPHHCRWPIDGPFKKQTFGFCGRERLKGLPYCKRHAARAFPSRAPVTQTVSEQREKEAERV